ncbi:MAG: adenosine deaminase family protein [Cellulomonadaceae bacterium]|jgi:adenosine deaminase|nr:adenosine deaminase family protein [Cellulomonadaceae bacterium]
MNVADTLLEMIPRLPKVLLHDHLDGGLRPETVITLAAAVGHKLPTTDPSALADWFHVGGGITQSSLEQYLEAFAHTVAVMQTADALRQVAREAVLDLAADNVIYTEQRWAPEQHQAGGLSLDDAVVAVQQGLAEGMKAAAQSGHFIMARQILCAMRQNDRWDEIADLTARHLNPDQPGGVVGFDLAGPEAGFPASLRPEVFRRLAEQHVPVTIHAGEGDGVASISSAIQVGRAVRLGHGVRITDDIGGFCETSGFSLGELQGFSCNESPGLSPSEAPGLSPKITLGPTANWVRDRPIPLEVAPSSNLQTGAASATNYRNHPITRLKNAGFTVTVNTDNRLMSRTSMSGEMQHLVTDAGWDLPSLQEVTLNAARAAFIHAPLRNKLIAKKILPDYRKAAQVLGRAS